VRAISAADDALHTATGGRAVFFRAKVKDSGGTFRDLTTYAGQNLCLSADWKENVDSPGLEADITLKREVEKISVAPLMTGSPVNLAFAYPGSYSALVAIAREVQIDVAVMPDGRTPASSDWNLAFHGYIDDVDTGAGAHVVLRCSDLQAKLRDTFIERERVYSFAQGVNATKGCCTWRANETLADGTRGLPTDGRKNGHFYRITAHTTGITGSVEPTWPGGAGATVVDGGVTWTESGSVSLSAGTPVETIMQQILDDNIGGITLNVPVSPSWSIKAYKVERSNVWDALKKLSDQIGWDLRYKWDSGTSSFKLTLYTPNRANTTADRTFTAAQRFPLTKLSTQIQWIRNAVQVVYNDSADLDANKRPKRKTVVRTDATSITAYGRRFCEVAEAAASNIDSSTEANALADAILSDLANPVAEFGGEVPFFRFAELGDLYQWNADALHFDTNQKLAVTEYGHKISENQARTTLQCRGKPSTGLRHWHHKIDTDLHALDLANADQTTVATSNGVGGTRIQITPNTAELKGGLPVEHDVHVSASAGFTPDSSNLIAQGANTNVTVHDLIPGKTYYGKVRPKGHNRLRPVRSEPTAEFSFVAGPRERGPPARRNRDRGLPDQWRVRDPSRRRGHARSLVHLLGNLRRRRRRDGGHERDQR
jgi:hypothetical protein